MSDHPTAMFIADASGLDFLNSVATPIDEPIDWIRDGRGLVDWLRQAGLVPEHELHSIASRAMPGELDRVADQARDLREWFRGFVNRHLGRPLDPDILQDLAPLNRLLERDEAYGRIARQGGALVFEEARRWRSPESLLIPIGAAMARVIVEEDFTHLKTCEGHGCTLVFADHTRGRRRRWCSMSVCGNRAKVSAHRSRQKAG
ncbi:CGNR zinc finger domain-containing protein [Lysobacter panacisoli]|uniref:CGNR zinc finger domain-containing protein n=1 Tax=Lysobacter panacisoli TaxID=1255263 RepID=A0ABP9LQ24_9GAMM|nr:ABATE domain-containing protein [Lysobacter panacisoli]